MSYNEINLIVDAVFFIRVYVYDISDVEFVLVVYIYFYFNDVLFVWVYVVFLIRS